MALDSRQLKVKKGDILVKDKIVPEEYKVNLAGAKYFEVIYVSDNEVHMYGISPLGRMHFYRELPVEVKCWVDVIRKKNRFSVVK